MVTASRSRTLFGGAMLALSATAATAGTIVLQNDSVVDFGTVAIQAGFIAEEEGAAWLTSTCDGELTKVRILWLSAIGGGGTTLGESIKIYQSGTFPVPGPLIEEFLGPQMIEGGFNEFDLAPSITVTNGQTVVVSFKFLSSPPAIGPSLVTDTDGCQEGKNGIFALAPFNAWVSSCFFGVGGDWAIRAVVACTGMTNDLFLDGFESGDTSQWSSTMSRPW